MTAFYPPHPFNNTPPSQQPMNPFAPITEFTFDHAATWPVSQADAEARLVRSCTSIQLANLRELFYTIEQRGENAVWFAVERARLRNRGLL